MESTKQSVIGTVEGILRDYEDGYKWGSLVSELTYSDLKYLVSLAKKVDHYQQVLSQLSNITTFSFSEKQALEQMNHILLPNLTDIKR